MLDWASGVPDSAAQKGEVAVQNSQQMLVPLPSTTDGHPPPPDGRITVAAAVLGEIDLDAIISRVNWTPSWPVSTCRDSPSR
jgi:hypothetical protein